MRPGGARRLLAAALLWAFAAAGGAVHAGEWIWTDVPRVVAVGDLHGADAKLVELLRAAELIDAEGAWCGGRDHLVVVGDYLDRGAGGREIMDRLIRLEQEAAAAGGRVHALLGNHELMNLIQDLRYVSARGYADFLAGERPAERREAFAAFREAQRRTGLSEEELQAAFERQFRPGYFGRKRAFQADGEYGAWLLERPAVVSINGTVYLHGGLTEEIAEMGVDAINRGVQSAIRGFLEARERLIANGRLDPYLEYSDQIAALERLVESAGRPALPPALRQAALTMLQFGDLPLFGSGGPFWYRGNSLESERFERLRVERVLEALGARAMVIGHTPTRGDTITSRFHGTVYRVDVGMIFGSSPQALVQTAQGHRVLDTAMDGLRIPAPEAPAGERFDGILEELPDRQVERMLREAIVTDVRELGRGGTRPKLLEMTLDDAPLRALFKHVPASRANGERDAHEVAAYLLDRRLGLRFVPVTVFRNVFGTQGSLSIWVEGAVGRDAISAYEIPFEDPAVLEESIYRVRIFDALIGLPDRSRSDILFIPSLNRVILVDHAGAFPLDREPAWGDAGPPPKLDAGLRQSLAALNERVLADTLGRTLRKKQIRALLARRDAILERYD